MGIPRPLLERYLRTNPVLQADMDIFRIFAEPIQY